jgi:tetratricopeptide (TPR) repeat protein
MASFRRAIELEPNAAPAHYQLGRCLQDRGRLDEAMAEYRRAIDLGPKGPLAYHHLGLCLQDRGQLDEAMASYRRAIELDPKQSASHHNLGLCLQARGDLDEAMASYRRAIELDPKRSASHHHLGMCLQARGDFDEAMTMFRRAIELDPRGFPAHYHLGVCLEARDRLEEAIVEFRKATELDARSRLGHEALATALLRRGRFTEARTAAQRGLDLLPDKDPGRPALLEKLKLCERLLDLDARLPTLLEGKKASAVAELLDLANLCREYGRPYTAVRLYTAAFTARPALGNDLGSSNRYNAACVAARAGAYPSEKPPLEAPQRSALRRQALDWLRADLALRRKRLQASKFEGWALAYWQTDKALADVRDPAQLAKLPPDERKEWQQFWTEVETLLAADLLEQGRKLAARRQWSRALDCYRAFKPALTDNSHVWFEYAAVLLLSGDRQGYGKACAHMVERCRKKGHLRAYHMARACTLAPDSVAEGSQPGELAQTELTRDKEKFWALTQQAALHYRAGKFKEAPPLLEQSLRVEPKSGCAVLNWLWLALVNQRLGRLEEAHRWLARATAWLDRYEGGMPSRAEEKLGLHLHNWLEAHVLRREAEALLGTRPVRPK